MNAVIYTAICIVSLAIVIYAAIFLFWILRMIWEYLQDEVLSDPVGRLFCLIACGLFTAAGILYFFGF